MYRVDVSALDYPVRRKPDSVLQRALLKFDLADIGTGLPESLNALELVNNIGLGVGSLKEN